MYKKNANKHQQQTILQQMMYQIHLTQKCTTKYTRLPALNKMMGRKRRKGRVKSFHFDPYEKYCTQTDRQTLWTSSSGLETNILVHGRVINKGCCSGISRRLGLMLLLLGALRIGIDKYCWNFFGKYRHMEAMRNMLEI